ncbi:MAG: glucose-1-phosphate adenylyltransferase family protein [Candidatus Eisenbacteria bacterium]
MRRVMAIVLAGGRSEGLGVLTIPRAAPALPFGGKHRVIDFTLSNCMHSEIFRVALLTQHQPTSLVEHIGGGRPWDLDRLEGGVRILQPFVRRESSHWYRGTADALAQNLNAIENASVQQVVVASGDHVYLMDYGQLIQAHEDSGARVTIGVTMVPRERSARYGMVALDDQQRVRSFVEKPEETDLRWASMGLYVFDAGWLLRALEGLEGPDLVYDVILPALAAGERIQGFRYEGYWEDIGELGTYYRANRELLSDRPALRLDDPRWTVLTRNEERPPARFGAKSKVANSLVTGGARVDGEVRNSVIFPGAWIEEGAVVEDSIVFHDGWIGRGARVAGAILDKDAIVGDEARVGEPGAALELPHGLAVLGKESVVLAGEQIGAGTSVPVGGGRGRALPLREAAPSARGEWPR